MLGTEEQPRMANGDVAVNAGAAPHKLRVDLDKGVVVISGSGVKFAPGQSFTTVRAHYISGADGTMLAGRAKARRAPVATADGVELDEPPRDFLDDIAEVIGTVRRMPTREALTGLVRLAPAGGAAGYRDWTFGQLTAGR